MCGITAVIQLDGAPVDEHLVKQMTQALIHRGPDGEGHLVDGQIGFGHRRLAIIDLSPLGAQPMSNQEATIWITYNGELYNYRELRQELITLGYTFRSQSDTEVIIRAYEAWGDACLGRFNGMFAFTLLDKPHQRVLLARDRFGVKPLYIFYQPNVRLLASSEIKGLLAHPALKAKLCYEGLQQYFLFQNIYTDHTLFEGVRLLPHGCSLSIDLNTGDVTQQRYWDFDFSQSDNTLSQKAAEEELYRLFVQAVTRQLISDVPLGSYLSGGMDSGSIVAVAASHLSRLKTFTGGFDLTSASTLERYFDERQASEVMANVFGTEHYEVIMRPGDMEYVLPRLVWHLEDLRVGQSYPNYYIARLASKFVKVVLSGGGGDELFAGYPWRYQSGLKSRTSNEYFESTFSYWQRLMPSSNQANFFKASVRGKLQPLNYAFEVFRQVYADYPDQLTNSDECVNASLTFDAKTFLQGLFLVDDKLMMAHGLEGRVPFMDNDLVDFAMKIPPRLKLDYSSRPEGQMDEIQLKAKSQLSNHDGKKILRSALNRLIPNEIAQRSKQGFSAPDSSWFRNESSAYIKQTLGNDARIYDYFDHRAVQILLDEHNSGHHNHRLLIWSLLCFEWWNRIFLEGKIPQSPL